MTLPAGGQTGTTFIAHHGAGENAPPRLTSLENPLPVTGSSATPDGGNVALGATSDAVASSDTGTFSLIALFKRLLQKLTTGIGITSLPALPAGSNNIGVVSVSSVAAGSNIIGKVGVDQTTPGTTNNVTTSRAAVASVAHRTITGLDGAYPPVPGVADPFWAANPGGKQIARFLVDIVIRATTALADDPVITLRPYVRHGGSDGYVGAGESVSFARPRLKDLSSIKAQHTTDNGANYTDSSANVIDNTTGVMTLNSLDTIANGDWIVLGGPAPFSGVALDYTNLNANANDLSVEYWNGSAWVAVSNLVDGTDTGASGAADGQVTWDGGAGIPVPPTWVAHEINGITAYWVRLGVSAAVDSAVTLTEVDLLFPIKAAIDVQADGDDVTLMLESISSGLTGTIAYSGTTRVSWR